MKKILALAAILCLPAGAAILQIGGNGVNGFKEVPVNTLEKSHDCAPGVCTFNQFIEGTGPYAILPDQSGDVVAISDPAGSGWETLPFWFDRETEQESITLIWEIAYWKPRNEFGWYDLSAPSVLYKLFSGYENAPGSITKVFKPTASFGVYMKTPVNNIQRSSDPATSNMFALYANTKTDTLYMGTEDLVIKSDRDFNDMILSIGSNLDRKITVTPEPGTYAMMGTGLTAVWFLSRRRRRS